MEKEYKFPTWEERLAEVREARENFLKGDFFDAIQIIIRRHPYWDGNGYIDTDWFLKELNEEEQWILDEPKRAKKAEERMRNYEGPVYTWDDDGNIIETYKKKGTIEF